jgi:hypothetical protein
LEVVGSPLVALEKVVRLSARGRARKASPFPVLVQYLVACLLVVLSSPWYPSLVILALTKENFQSGIDCAKLHENQIYFPMLFSVFPHR